MTQKRSFETACWLSDIDHLFIAKAAGEQRQT